MLQYQNQAELDAARQEWFQLAGERRKAREEHKRRLEDAREKHKEWWGYGEGGGAGAGAREGLSGDGEMEGLERREENKVDDRGVRRGGIYRGT